MASNDAEIARLKEKIRNLQELIKECYDPNNPDLPRWRQEIKGLESEIRSLS
jgi:chromosome segregation ATPase